MSYSELANWDGSLSAKKPRSKRLVTYKHSSSSHSGTHNVPAPGGLSKKYTTKLAPGSATEVALTSGGGSILEKVDGGEGTTAAGVKTRPSTLNAIVFAFGNEQVSIFLQYFYTSFEYSRNVSIPSYSSRRCAIRFSLPLDLCPWLRGVVSHDSSVDSYGLWLRSSPTGQHWFPPARS